MPGKRGSGGDRAGFCGNSSFSFLPNLHSHFQSSYTSLHSQQQWTKAPLCLYPHQQFFVCFLFLNVILLFETFIHTCRVYFYSIHPPLPPSSIPYCFHLVCLPTSCPFFLMIVKNPLSPISAAYPQRRVTLPPQVATNHSDPPPRVGSPGTPPHPCGILINLIFCRSSLVITAAVSWCVQKPGHV